MTLTVLKNGGGPLAKAYSVDDAGRVQSAGTRAQLVRGTARRVQLQDAGEFVTLLGLLGTQEAFAFGVFSGDTPSQTIVAEKDYTGQPGTITRTRDHFSFHAGPTIMQLDVDAEHLGRPIGSVEEERQRLVDACPFLADACMVGRASGSSFLFVGEKQQRGVNGVRFYVPIEDGRALPDLGEVIYSRLWLAGHGRYIVSKSGALLERNLVDRSVWRPEWLDFAAGAVCTPPLEQRRPPAQTWGDPRDLLDPCEVPDLTDDERRQVERLKGAARAAVQGEAQRVRASFVQAREEALRAAGRWDQGSGARLHRAIEHGELVGDFELVTEQGEPVTVREVLNDPTGWHGKRFRDPIEPDYRGDTRVAWANLLSGEQVLYSHAHGGTRYALRLAPLADDFEDLTPAAATPPALAAEPAPPAEDERERSTRIARDGEHEVPTQRMLTLTEMLEHLVYLEDGSRVTFLDKPRAVLPLTDFKNAFAGSVERVKGPNGRKVAVSRVKQWLESQARKTVRTQTFAPGRARICDSPDGELSLNLWVPRAAAAPENWRELARPFFEHVAYLVPVEAERERFLDWLAHIEQQPGVLPHTHYLLRTSQTGIGRNWLAYALARAFAGYVALGFDLAESLRSGFNGALSQRLLAVVDELHEGGPRATRSQAAEKLKSMLTEQTRRVNPKYGRQHTEFNCCRFLMFSNHEAALPLAENDRRVVVIENPTQRRGEDYYRRLYALLGDPGLGPAIAQALRARDISGFNPGAIAPMTEAKARTIRAGRSEIEQAVRDVAAAWPADCITSPRLWREVSEALGDSVKSVQGACVAAGLDKFPKPVKVRPGETRAVLILRDAPRWSLALPAEVAAECLRGEAVADQDRDLV
ncbi:MAG: DUF5906 domain-containing protein [Rubrivivax sp.]